MCFTVQLSRLFVCHLFSTAYLLYHIFQILSSTFSKVFQIFKKLYKVVCFCRSVQATWLLYHKFSHLSTVNLNFLKTILFFSISEAIPCDSLFTIPPPQGIVKHFFTKNPYFFVQVILTFCCNLISSLFSHLLSLTYTPYRNEARRDNLIFLPKTDYEQYAPFACYNRSSARLNQFLPHTTHVPSWDTTDRAQ